LLRTQRRLNVVWLELVQHPLDGLSKYGYEVHFWL
jgi:hypothetical protein